MSTLPSHPAERPAVPDPQEPATADASADPEPYRALYMSDPDIIASTPPAIVEAQRTFFRDLPQLLKEHPGKWVAYHGAKRIAFGESQRALWRECERLGYEDFLVRRIRPYPPTDYISAV